MARKFMPQSSALMPYIVANRDAAVAGVFTVDGEGGSVDLTGKYVQIEDYNQRVGSLEAQVTTNKDDITNIKTSVSSINSSIGAINTSLNNKAAKGVNSDITGLTALSGPLRLGGDAASDYDAVTLKQLVAASGGSGGASMSGVMNNFLGAVEWFNGSRAKLPSGHLAADGQVLNRADYPDIWNAINSGLFVSVTDTAWLADADGRAKYSTGNGTTTFRMPDLNGAITSGVPSVRALFLRGDQGLSGGVGSTGRSVAPNITGTLSTVVTGQFFLPTGPSASGALSPVDSPSNVLSSVPGYNTAAAPSGVQIDASKSSSVYTNGATEVRPNFAAGIWIIRVNGKFSASNTNFNVITGDAELPANNTVVYGGEVKSVYQVGGVDTSTASFRSKYTVGGTKTVELKIADSGGSTAWTMPTAGGELALKSASIQKAGDTFTGTMFQTVGTLSNGYKSDFGFIKNVNGAVSTNGTVRNLFAKCENNQYQRFEMDCFDTGSDIQARIVSFNNTNFNAFYVGVTGCGDSVKGAFAYVSSDRKLKENIKDSDSKGARSRIEAIKTRDFTWKLDGRDDRGFIAQELLEVDEKYAYTTAGSDIMGVSDRAIIADLVDVVKEQYALIDELKTQISELRSQK